MINFNNREDVVNKLAELKAKNLPHMTIEQLANICPDFKKDIQLATDEEKELIERELDQYHMPTDNNNCIFSGELPILNWGLRHGAGIDNRTGLTWECIQYFKINGNSKKYNMVLQYHPDNYVVNETDV